DRLERAGPARGYRGGVCHGAQHGASQTAAPHVAGACLAGPLAEGGERESAAASCPSQGHALPHIRSSHLGRPPASTKGQTNPKTMMFTALGTGALPRHPTRLYWGRYRWPCVLICG